MEKINTSCYIINFYLGDRRKTIEEYNINDRLCFLKEQIETLYQYKHSLNKIIFNDTLDWVNCDAVDENGDPMRGNDIYISAAHEFGHAVRKDSWHSKNPEDVMHNPSPQRCPAY